VHGWPVLFAMSEFAIVCRDATVVIAPAINITIAVLVTPAKFALIAFGFCIADHLTIAPIHTDIL
jgi:hypothetical protein